MSVFTKAKRIWSIKRDEPNQYALFQDHFSLLKNYHKVMMRIRADNRYSVTINGEWIPAQQYSDYDFAPTFDEFELPASVLKRNNNLSILAYCQNEDSFTYRIGEPSLIYEILADGDVIAYSSANTMVSLDTGFQSGLVEKITMQLSYSFRYDGSKLGKSHYVPAIELEERPFSYRIRPLPQLTVGNPIPGIIIAQGVWIDSKKNSNGEAIYHDYLSSRHFSEMASGEKKMPSAEGITLQCPDGDGVYAVIDLQNESAGYVLFEFEVPDECDIRVGFGEHLEDLRVRSSLKGRNFAFSVHAVKGKNKCFWPIKRFGCRYFQVHAASHEIKLYYLGLRSVEYPFQQLRIPLGLDHLQQEIYDVSVKTLRLCAHEHYEDTPWREQALYSMDSRNEMLFGYLAFGEVDLARESLRLMALGQKPYGLLELCSPAGASDNVNIPCFSLIWICALDDYYQFTNDVAFIKEMLPYAERIFSFFDKYINQQGVVASPKEFWNFYEWSDGLHGHIPKGQTDPGTNKAESPLNAFYILALNAYGRLLKEVCNLSEKADQIQNKIKRIQESYLTQFFSPEKQAFRFSTNREESETFPELVQALSILAGIRIHPDIRESLLQRLLNGSFQPSTTLSHRIYLYQAVLSLANMKEWVLADVESRWFPMLRKGATSFWETEKGANDFNGAGSLCHGWSAVPIWVYWHCFSEKTRKTQRIIEERSQWKK